MIPAKNTVPYESIPVATYGIIVCCGLAFAYQLVLPDPSATGFILEHALVPARYTSGTWAQEQGLARADFLPFVTSMFLHGGFLHILSNMWTLWIFGPPLEDRLGSVRFVLLYVLAGVAAGLVHVVFNFNSTVPALGASGAIAGVIASFVKRFPYAWLNVLQPVGLLPLFLYMPAVFFAGLWFTTQVLMATSAFLMPSAAGGVAWWAHIGGFLAGWLLLSRVAPAGDPMAEHDSAAQSTVWPWGAWPKLLFWWWWR